VPLGATNNDFPELVDEWARRWPAEEVWFARRSSAAQAAVREPAGPGEDPTSGYERT
jgi:hypothetical protein